MCCEICPRYVSCEEDDRLSDLCCVSCRDYASCHPKGASEDGGADEFEEELDEI